MGIRTDQLDFAWDSDPQVFQAQFAEQKWNTDQIPGDQYVYPLDLNAEQISTCVDSIIKEDQSTPFTQP
jgi:hypothetical protein